MKHLASGQHLIYISVGSNIEREKHTKAGLQAMYEVFGHLQLSRVYESESVGFAGHNFYNLVVKAQTSLSIEQVCLALKQIEDQNKRQRGTAKFSPRTLDLDLLLFDDVVSRDPVELPRSEILFNAFVLQPLAEIAGEQIHPVVGSTFSTLWHEYDKSQQQLWPIEFTWNEN
ncbi:2-amino-4-hydroxy-6-hydroxymethyldihydropteridine diphosphokinase [Paraglaciecola hydrolytica]|uniref:2-amino-4-hydroxy-6-hydroxymethyldihydropteridine diphosphokinase n=1 Tax=Paraglaciecola hydrolytica TaxID=1799789 RepID=A0A136A031_9ALTE|nr:2-amino-4-hydroxy-6-hydroxymethyldihydropteridine diphosphokinase [Paraglaciecola hydrolytica]KXI28606.1 2-amino-4-hydroxy-6-hydroxymethyldihydropteridine pyrophosphokinase [Paraglaciecola hydrolytica]